MDDGTHVTTLRYDAFDRVIQITTTETATSTVTEDIAFVWCGMSICQERDGAATAAVTRELYDFGHREGTTKRFYIKDHLGSVRGMVDDTGAITSAFDYDPYGRMTPLSGTETPSYGFAQLWHHEQTGLDLAVWRAYDPEIGRWLNRDPIGMAGGINVYEYANSSPMAYIDPDGHVPLAPIFIGAGIGGGSNLAWQLYKNNGNIKCVSWSQVGIATGLGALTGQVGRVIRWAYNWGVEWKPNNDWRFAPFGNRTKDNWEWMKELPHYHRRGPKDPKTGETVVGQGVGRHRPWETKSSDTTFWDRF